MIVEVDGYRSHGTRTAFERDRKRDVALSVLGYRVLRFTYRRVMEAPAEVVGALRRLVSV